MIAVDVYGIPRPQGSLSLFRSKDGREVAKYGQPVIEWRALVTTAVRAAWPGPMLEGAVMVSVVFEMPRPLGHFGSGRNAGTLKPSAPPYPANGSDLDKLVRAIGDGITDAGTVWRDDSQVCRLVASKIYVPVGSVPGCSIRICQATP